MNTQRKTIGGAWACWSAFEREGGVGEYHVMIHAASACQTYKEQLEAVLDAYQHLLDGELKGCVAVFKRYFLSDAANQADEILAADASDCAKSIIQQPPLDGTKIGMWAYLMTGVITSVLPSGLCLAAHGSYRHLWNASAHNLATNSEYQTRLLFNEYVMQLMQEGCTLAGNCIRTWLFVNDVDINYAGMVQARNKVFFTQGLTQDTHFIASTGIGGRQQDANVLTQMDNYAVGGIVTGQTGHLYAPAFLNRTSDYGVSFERGTYVDYGDRRQVFISGTASINNKGQVVHQRDVVSQTRRVWDNVEALLAEAGCTYGDVGQMIVYLRDMADYAVVRQMYEERFADRPYIIVNAAVCRTAWLVEMECMAVREADNPEYASF